MSDRSESFEILGSESTDNLSTIPHLYDRVPEDITSEWNRRALFCSETSDEELDIFYSGYRLIDSFPRRNVINLTTITKKEERVTFWLSRPCHGVTKSGNRETDSIFEIRTSLANRLRIKRRDDIRDHLRISCERTRNEGFSSKKNYSIAILGVRCYVIQEKLFDRVES